MKKQMDMEKLSNEELEKLCANAKKIIAERQNQRKKELWENVVVAIKKYQNEIDYISVQGYGEAGAINLDKLDDIGYLYTYG